MALPPTPSQTVGPFFRLGLTWLDTVDLARDATAGTRISIAGQMIDGKGEPVPDAMIEVWQANAHGRYNHPEDRQDRPIDPGFSGFGRIPTDSEGRFRFLTIKPGAVPGPGNSLQAPHILVAVFMRGLLRHFYTRIYFSDEAANATDPVLSAIEDAERRATLIAQHVPGTGDYRWDIVLQGERETVVFAC